MGDSAPQPNAQNLRDILVGLSRFEQQKAAIQWARENHCVVDMFGAFAKEHHLLLAMKAKIGLIQQTISCIK